MSSIELAPCHGIAAVTPAHCTAPDTVITTAEATSTALTTARRRRCRSTARYTRLRRPTCTNASRTKATPKVRYAQPTEIVRNEPSSVPASATSRPPAPHRSVSRSTDTTSNTNATKNSTNSVTWPNSHWVRNAAKSAGTVPGGSGRSRWFTGSTTAK